MLKKKISGSKTTPSSVKWGLIVAALVFQNVAVAVMSSVATFEGRKNFFLPSPYPNARTPPIVSYNPPAPAHGSSGGGGHPTTPTTPHHGTPPAANCGNPPARSGGGSSSHHHHNPSPAGGSGGYHHSPPSSTTPPTTPSPVIITPPSFPTPSPPSSFDPNSPPFTCTYWRNHPTLIWGLFGGWFGTVGSAFGVTSLPGFGSNTNLLQALSNTRTDGLGELYREGTAALLNSMADHTAKYPYSTTQVRDSFVAALGSNHAASAQARLFKMANEGKIKT